jgi:Ca2+-binding RTX toxin-like protein
VPSDTPAPGASISGTVQQSGGTTRLVIVGTDGNDVITLSYNGSATSLASGAGTQTFAGYYGYISVYGFGGDDVIRLDYSIMGSTLVYAGDGNDKVYENSQGAATIYGGAGDDLLIAVGGGNDIVYGEAGTDSYWADTTDTLADSTSAEASAKTVHRVASFYQPYSADPASIDYVSKDIDSQSLRDPTTGYAVSNYANRPLFVDGPQYDDIRQGALGDCYYLAVLASMSDTDPNLISQAITELGDGTYAVRFYRGGAEVYLRLDADMPSAYAKLTPDGETWVMLMEKAYAFFRYGSNCYSSIEGGWMSTVVGELTGASSQTQWTGGSATSLASYIGTNLAAGHSITLGSYSTAASPVVGGHAYMVKSIEGVGDAAYVTVYNPWGVDGRSYDSNYNDGLLRLSIAKIQECFSATVVALV